MESQILINLNILERFLKWAKIKICIYMEKYVKIKYWN